MRKIHADALQLLKGNSTSGEGVLAVLLQHTRGCCLAYLKLQGELIGRVFAHVFEVGVKVVELHWTEKRARAIKGDEAKTAGSESSDHHSPGQLPLLQCRLAPTSSRH